MRSDPILDLAALPDGGVIAVTELQVRRVNDDGSMVVLLDADTGSTTPDAKVHARAVTVQSGVSSCCVGTTFYGAAVSSQTGNVYILDDEIGRILRIAPDRTVTKVGGPSPRAVGCEPTCASEEGGPAASSTVEGADVMEVAFIPEVVSAQPSSLAVTTEGTLMVALGAAGLLEIGDIDGISGT